MVDDSGSGHRVRRGAHFALRNRQATGASAPWNYPRREVRACCRRRSCRLDGRCRLLRLRRGRPRGALGLRWWAQRLRWWRLRWWGRLTITARAPDTRKTTRHQVVLEVARAGIEPATFRFSGGRSYQLSYLAGRASCLAVLATLTGLEPATSAVTGRRANQRRHRALHTACASLSRCVPPTGFEPVLPP